MSSGPLVSISVIGRGDDTPAFSPFVAIDRNAFRNGANGYNLMVTFTGEPDSTASVVLSNDPDALSKSPENVRFAGHGTLADVVENTAGSLDYYVYAAALLVSGNGTVTLDLAWSGP